MDSPHQYFSSMSVLNKVTLILIIFISIPVLALVLTYLGKFSDDMYRMQEEHQESLLKSVNFTITNDCRQVTNALGYLEGMEEVKQYITSDFHMDSSSILNLTYDVDNAFSLISGLNSKLIGRITFYSTNPTQPEHGNRFHNIKWLDNDVQLKEFVKSDAKTGWFFNVSDGIYLQVGQRTGYSAVYAEKVEDVQNNLYGVFVVRVLYSNLFEALGQAGDGLPITLSDTAPKNCVFLYSPVLSRYLCQKYDIGAIRFNVQTSCLYILLLTILGLFGMTLLIRGLLKLVFRNMYNMINTMEHVAHGNFNMRIPIEKSADIGRITVQFNAILDQLNDYIQQMMELEEQSRKTRISALQLQMNPHFFYNGLGMLQCAMEEDNKYGISDAISWLSQILRYNMSGAVFATISDEIKYTGLYISFINTFRPCPIDLEISADHSVYDQSVPKFILQPLVENAVKYGDGKYIRIRIGMSEKVLEITVSNSGKRLEDAYVSTINSNLRSAVTKEYEGKIGLRNIASRLKLFYSDNCDIYLESEEETSVHIIIGRP